ncbi:DUF4276 family protein [Erwinia mallotivora]|nr:DUF4276 family protein [Erwinia mallotivora]
MEYITIATEDELSEAVAVKIIELTDGKFSVNQRLRKNSFGYLKSKINNFCNLSEHFHVFMITDLDTLPCAPTLKKTWFKNINQPEKLIFRVAVREIEAWIIADHDGMYSFLGDKIGRIPVKPDELPNPKATLLSLAQKAPRKIKNGLIAKKGTLAIQGVEYNLLLCDFVRKKWNPVKASERSESLKRAITQVQFIAKQF